MKLTFFISMILFMLLNAGWSNAYAQTEQLTQARVFAEKKEYDKAAGAYRKLRDQDPVNAEIYNEYLSLLISMKEFKAAEKLINEYQNIRKQSPLVEIDLGRVYLAAGKDKKAEEQFEKAVSMLNGDDIVTQQVANAFALIGKEEYVLKTYERARDLLRNPYLYSGPLARLYAKSGRIDKAIYTLLEAGPGQMGGLDETKASLLEFLGTDAKKVQQAQKAVVKKINEQPENPYYAELLTWLYTQKDDWEGALIQMQALDERNREQGERMLEFARLAAKEKQFEYALKSYDAIIDKGNGFPYFGIAKAEKLNTRFQYLQENITRTNDDILKLQKDYEDFLNDFPQYYSTPAVRDYAMLTAQFAHDPQKAVNILQKAIEVPAMRRDQVGLAKLQMGDYHILLGNVWEASLTYSQVDKSFREDMLGEEARFRNAKLAYYRGDFDWAQGQLSVLKASTSELIANDALYLSVLITENIPPDSNMVPLERFAFADLLLFQNKDTEAEQLLDSINRAFPEHPLKDDILMQRAKIAQKHLDYNKALVYLSEIHEKHKDDVLGDDALFHSAEINEKYLDKKEEAKKFYEQLIIEYPGSTFVQAARNRLGELSGAPIP